MDKELSEYPKVTEFVSKLSQPNETFLNDRLSNPDYGFWPHFEYFLANLDRFTNHTSIISRLSLTAPLSMDIPKAWAKWQKFRSAQSEVTTIYLIEKYFLGRVIEIIPESKLPTPDLNINLGNKEFLIEIKAQSGQQHGDKHPRARGMNAFDPRYEPDLRSWLFEERISSRSGKLMNPKILEADKKGAEILVAMTDFFTTINDIKSQVSAICPTSNFVKTMSFENGNGDLLTAHFFEVKYPVEKSLNNLKEIWLYNESNLDRFIVLSDNSMYLLSHLKK